MATGSGSGGKGVGGGLSKGGPAAGHAPPGGGPGHHVPPPSIAIGPFVTTVSGAWWPRAKGQDRDPYEGRVVTSNYRPGVGRANAGIAVTLRPPTAMTAAENAVRVEVQESGLGKEAST